MTNQEPIVQQIAAELIDGTSFEHFLTLRCGECSLRVEANREEIIAGLRRYYQLFVVDYPGEAVTIRFIEDEPPTIPGDLTTKRPDPEKEQPIGEQPTLKISTSEPEIQQESQPAELQS